METAQWQGPRRRWAAAESEGFVGGVTGPIGNGSGSGPLPSDIGRGHSCAMR